MKLVINPIKNKIKDAGYKWFSDGIYNVNIIGVRSSNRRRTNKFDDSLYLVYKNEDHNWELKAYPITTDPGFTALMYPLNTKGTAILVPGQYRGAYKIGKHKGKYDALVQRGNTVKVYRDNNRDYVHDFKESSIDKGYFGINIHKAGINSSVVNNWSAGCQVFKREDNFREFMEIINKSASIYGNSLTYSLLEI